MGKRVEAGTATITKADILSACDSPSQIVIFRNNEIWKTLDYQGEDITVDIPEDGNYCYMVADEIKPLGYHRAGRYESHWRYGRLVHSLRVNHFFYFKKPPAFQKNF